MHVIILYCKVNYVYIMACNFKYLLVFVWLLIVKTDKHLLLLWLYNYDSFLYHYIIIGQQNIETIYIT